MEYETGRGCCRDIVVVMIQPLRSDPDRRRRLIDSTCGSTTSDATINITEEFHQRRLLSPSNMSFFAGLVGLDAFPKANDEYRLKTNTGAIG